jgi:N-methylhydantoinase A/oxoprolinase/acetone carboxylase beta subunit
MGSGFVDAPVYDGSRLGPGVEVRGPALVEEPFTVVVLPPGATARLDELGNYELTVS